MNDERVSRMNAQRGRLKSIFIDVAVAGIAVRVRGGTDFQRQLEQSILADPLVRVFDSGWLPLDADTRPLARFPSKRAC